MDATQILSQLFIHEEEMISLLLERKKNKTLISINVGYAAVFFSKQIILNSYVTAYLYGVI